MDIGLMIEGQDGLNWPRWQRILRTAEDLGFQCVFRSDHFVNPSTPDKDSLETWSSLTYAASHTARIEFGPLVSPVTFRHPSMLARVAAGIDDLSGGRLTLGLGAGWNEREHSTFGVPFPPTSVRYEMLEEYLEVVTRLLRSDQPVSFSGNHYQLRDAILLPRPHRPSGPPILIGGNGPRRTLPLAARFADEWNAVFIAPDALRDLTDRFLTLLDDAGRPRDSVRRSAMIGTLFARDERSLQEKLAQRGRTAEEIMARGLIVGTPAMWIEQLRHYAELGLARIMLQWLEQDNMDDVAVVAQEVVPHI
jgi:F420-dependent oxidoreductase-like protein